ncbi:hypothetical protein LMG27177_07269 [Paraburkholderia fynbosensis]|uniref:Transposase n=1 Tax=Paraburkholderia fynbosensis TaxID=1200993 RepID=A0A6J5H4P9_9BURK|nr:hypothetical protein LMG27177_07269 [Paraburkholderia fynbosensis]
MKKNPSPYHGFRFRAAVISCSIRCYHRFNLSLRDVEELLLERGVVASYESVRNWSDRFGSSAVPCRRMPRRKMMSRKRSLTALDEQWFSGRSVATATAFSATGCSGAGDMSTSEQRGTCRHAGLPVPSRQRYVARVPLDPDSQRGCFKKCGAPHPTARLRRSSHYSRVLLIAVVRSDDLVAHSDDCRGTAARRLIPVGDAGPEKRTVREIAERVELRRFGVH